MKTILLFLVFVTLGFAQNPELFSNQWYLEKMVFNGVDYPTPTQYEHTIDFGTPIFENPNTVSSIDLTYCTGYYNFTGTINNENIVNEAGLFFNPENDNCDFSDYELGYMSSVYMFFGVHSPPIISYEINEVDNYKQLILTNLDNHQLYYNNITLSQEDFLFENTVSLYPNPVQNILNIQNKASNLSKIQIYDLNGRLLQNHSLQSQEVFLDVSDLLSGFYLVVLENELGQQVSRKIVKITK